MYMSSPHNNLNNSKLDLLVYILDGSYKEEGQEEEKEEDEDKGRTRKTGRAQGQQGCKHRRLASRKDAGGIR